MSKIPIQNLFNILCYAWGRAHFGKFVTSGIEHCETVPNLLATVLLSVSKSLLKQGLEKGYTTCLEEIDGIKGKMIFSDTIRHMSLLKLRAYCEYDELNQNVLSNQIVKSILNSLSKVENLDEQLRHDAAEISKRFAFVELIRIQNADFSKVSVHRNNKQYRFALKVCEMIHRSLIPNQKGTGYKFFDVLNDEKQMAIIFQAFVKNFYQLEQDFFDVKSENIKWDATSPNEIDLSLLPIMSTDISLNHPSRKIIIDTKYYSSTMQKRWSTEKVYSNHLYQLNAYLSNIENRGYPDNEATGILLYPTVDRSLDLKYNLRGNTVRVYTLNLNQDWSQIKEDLSSLIN